MQTTKTITPYNAARKVAAYLTKTYGEGALVWGRDDVTYYGWGNADAQVCWEGGPYDWPTLVSEAIFAGKLDLPGVFIEPRNSFILSFYRD